MNTSLQFSLKQKWKLILNDKLLWVAAFLLYLQFDFIHSLEYTIVNECGVKLFMERL